MLISRRGYNWNNVLPPNWWAYNWVGLYQDFTIFYYVVEQCNCTLRMLTGLGMQYD